MITSITKCGWNFYQFSISKYWSLWKKFHTTLRWESDYLYMLGFKLIHVRKRRLRNSFKTENYHDAKVLRLWWRQRSSNLSRQLLFYIERQRQKHITPKEKIMPNYHILTRIGNAGKYVGFHHDNHHALEKLFTPSGPISVAMFTYVLNSRNIIFCCY